VAQDSQASLAAIIASNMACASGPCWLPSLSQTAGDEIATGRVLRVIQAVDDPAALRVQRAHLILEGKDLGVDLGCGTRAKPRRMACLFSSLSRPQRHLEIRMAAGPSQ